VPIVREFNETENLLRVTWTGLRKGADTFSSHTEIAEGHVPTIQNLDAAGGLIERADGATLHATGMVDPNSTASTMFARYNPASASLSGAYILGSANGNMYQWNGTAWVTIRLGLSTTADLYWTYMQLSDYLVCVNRTDGNYKWDGDTFIPLGAKPIAQMETDEAWTTLTDEATTIREGTGAQSTGSITGGATVTGTLTPATNWNLTSGLNSAAAYTTADYINFFVNISETDNLASGYIRLGDDADSNYFQLASTSWGTLADGWNQIHVLKSAFTATGTPTWSDISKLTFSVTQQTAALTVIFDDCYMIYATVMPAAQFVREYKNMVIGASSTVSRSVVYYSPVSAPDQYDADAELPIAEDDGTEVTGLFPYYDAIIVGKDNSLHTISAKTVGTEYREYTWSTRRSSTDHGCSSHRTMREIGGPGGSRVGMLWRNQVRAFSGISSDKISYLITDTLDDKNNARLFKAVAAINTEESQYLLWWPGTGDTNNLNELRYNWDEDAWLQRAGQTMQLAETITVSGVQYVITVDTTGRALAQYTGETHDSTAITTILDLPWENAGRPDEMKDWVEWLVGYSSDSAVSITAQYRIADHPYQFDDATFTTAQTITTGAADELGHVRIGERSRWIQLRLTSSSTVAGGYEYHWPWQLKAIPTGMRY